MTRSLNLRLTNVTSRARACTGSASASGSVRSVAAGFLGGPTRWETAMSSRARGRLCLRRLLHNPTHAPLAGLTVVTEVIHIPIPFWRLYYAVDTAALYHSSFGDVMIALKFASLALLSKSRHWITFYRREPLRGSRLYIWYPRKLPPLTISRFWRYAALQIVGLIFLLY